MNRPSPLFVSFDEDDDLQAMGQWLRADAFNIRRLSKALCVPWSEVDKWLGDRVVPTLWIERVRASYAYLLNTPQELPPPGMKSVVKSSCCTSQVRLLVTCTGPGHDDVSYRVDIDTEEGYDELDTPIKLSQEGLSHPPLEFEPEEAEAIAHALLRAVEIRRAAVERKLKLSW